MSAIDKVKEFLEKLGINLSLFSIKDEKLAKAIESSNLGKILADQEGKNVFVIIGNPQIAIYQYEKEKLEEKIPEAFYVNHIGFVREDIAVEEALILYKKSEIKKIVKKLKPFMERPEDRAALNYSASIISLEQEGIDTKEMGRKLFKAYGARGKRICSLLRAGIFQRDIIPLIDEYENSRDETEKKELKKLISEIIEKIITFHPFVVFVHSFMSKYELKEEIEKRINQQITEFQLYAWGEYCITLAINTLEEIKKQLEEKNIELNYKQTTSKIVNKPCAIIDVEITK